MAKEVEEVSKDITVVNNFYINVKYICKEKKMTLNDIEKRIGVSPGYLSRVASGQRDLGIIKAYRIAETLEVPLALLLGEELWKNYRIKELKAELRALETEVLNLD